MRGREVKLQPAQPAPGLCRGKGLIEPRRGVGIEIIQHPVPLRSVGIGLIKQPCHLLGKGLSRPLGGHRHLPPAALWLAAQEQIAPPIPVVFVVLALGLARGGRQGRAGLGYPLLGGFIKADRWVLRVIRLFIEVQHVLQGRDELRAYRRDTPLLLLPRREVVFGRIWRTVSWLSDAASPHCTALSASKRSVHRAWPAGAVPTGHGYQRGFLLAAQFRALTRAGAFLQRTG